MSVEEGTHTLPDGVELYTKTWKVGFCSASNRGRGLVANNNNSQMEHLGQYWPLFMDSVTTVSFIEYQEL